MLRSTRKTKQRWTIRAAWKVYRERGDKKSTLEMFMKEMDNELWVTDCVEKKCMESDCSFTMIQ